MMANDMKYTYAKISFLLHIANVKQERRIQNFFSEDEYFNTQKTGDNFGLVARDDFFRDDA
ncbi:hypothetical protein [Halomonas citrativorans]|uniref:hypothetical protein n=1 Tax=Halomonas citrativorans TaxID=2742612 RepID=UPI0020CF083F|nr:hypothetical protein [Halomonas citrativorans]